MFKLHSGSVDYTIKKDFIHLIVTDSNFNTIEIVATKKEFDLLAKIILRK